MSVSAILISPATATNLLDRLRQVIDKNPGTTTWAYSGDTFRQEDTQTSGKATFHAKATAKGVLFNLKHPGGFLRGTYALMHGRLVTFITDHASDLADPLGSTTNPTKGDDKIIVPGSPKSTPKKAPALSARLAALKRS